MKANIMLFNRQQQQGFTLIEVMVAMLIGSFLMMGVFQVFLSSSEGQDIVYDQIELVDESRVALEMLAFDIKKAGLWGKTNRTESFIDNDDSKASFIIVRDQLAAANECINSLNPNNFVIGAENSGWALDVQRVIFGASEEAIISAGGIPYTGCISGDYLRGDTIEVRYAGETVLPADLDANTVYIMSQGQFSLIFYGAAPVTYLGSYKDDPSPPAITYHRYEAVLYYVSSWTDAVGDGLPSLRRVSLQSGPMFSDDVVLTGVENLQIQFGVDTDKNEDTQTIQQYLDPNSIVDTQDNRQWQMIRSVQAWMIVSSKQSRPENTSQTFTIPAIPAGTYVTAADGYKRIMVTTTNKLRNILMGGN